MDLNGHRRHRDRLRDLIAQVNTDPPSWSDHRLRSIERNDYAQIKSFLLKRHHSHQGMVALKDIDHIIARGGEVEVSWQSLLQACGKNIPPDDTWWDPGYWLGPGDKEGMSYVELDKKLLVSRGIYKTALARYVLHYANSNTLYGARVSRWSVDWWLLGTWCRLREVCRGKYPGMDVKPQKRMTASRQEGLWIVEEYELSLKRIELKTGHVLEVLGATEAQGWLDELQSGTANMGNAGPDAWLCNGFLPV